MRRLQGNELGRPGWQASARPAEEAGKGYNYSVSDHQDSNRTPLGAHLKTTVEQLEIGVTVRLIDGLRSEHDRVAELQAQINNF